MKHTVGIFRRLTAATLGTALGMNAIFDKLELGDTSGYSRRILSVLRYLGT